MWFRAMFNRGDCIIYNLQKWEIAESAMRMIKVYFARFYNLCLEIHKLVFYFL